MIKACLQCGTVMAKPGTVWKFCSRACADLYRSGEGMKVYKKHPPFTQEQAIEAFWQKVKKSDGCWIWTGNKLVRGGYGGLNWRGKISVKAHRVSYEIAHGVTLTPEQIVRHRCDNPLCVNPDHLVLGTHQDNVQDTWERGRAGKAPRQRMTQEIATEIRRLAATGMTQAAIAKKFGMSASNVSYILGGKTWSERT